MDHQFPINWLLLKSKEILNAGLRYILSQFFHTFCTRCLLIKILQYILWHIIYCKWSLKFQVSISFLILLKFKDSLSVLLKKMFLMQKKNDWKNKWQKWNRVCFSWICLEHEQNSIKWYSSCFWYSKYN